MFLLLLLWEPAVQEVFCAAWKAALTWSSRCLEQNCDLGSTQNKQAPL